MSKELPFFKFEPNQWENGNIQICSREDKGLFLDLCCIYWSRLGDLPFKLAVQKLCGGNASAFNSLLKERVFTIIDEFVCIEFLNEQLQEFDDLSDQNRKNALEGWKKRRKQKGLSGRNASALKSQSENNAIRGDDIRENKMIKEIEVRDVILVNNKNKYEKIIELFNNTCTELKPVLKLNKQREKNIDAIIKEYKPQDVLVFFEIVFNKVKESKFLNGHGSKNWLMTFDWMLNQENFLKIIENNYQDEKPNNRKQAKQYSDDFKRKIAKGLQS